ncbi:MAG: hypothetical protein AB1486_20955 [Planctomycetota bacterium]
MKRKRQAMMKVSVPQKVLWRGTAWFILCMAPALAQPREGQPREEQPREGQYGDARPAPEPSPPKAFQDPVPREAIPQDEERAVAEQRRAIENDIRALREEAGALEGMGHVEEAKARREKAERLAKELKDRLRVMRQERETAERIDAATRELEELWRRAEALEREGRREEAAGVRKKAEALAAELQSFSRERRHAEIAAVEERLAELRARAEEAEIRGDGQLAKELRHEAGLTEKRLADMLEELERREHVEAMEREVLRLQFHAESLDQAGKHDEARVLREEAQSIVKELEEVARARHEAHAAEIERRLEQLRVELHDLEAAGSDRRAREVRAEIHELELMLVAEREERELGTQIEAAKLEIESLRAQAERAEREGDLEGACTLRGQAEMLRHDFESRMRDRERHAVQEKIAALHARADEAEARGEQEAALQARHQAEQLEQKWAQEARGEASAQEMLAREIAALREEIRLLREEVERLRGRERGPEGRPAEETIRRATQSPEVRAVLDRLGARLFPETFDRERRLWILAIRAQERGPVLGRVMVTEEGDVRGITIEPPDRESPPPEKREPRRTRGVVEAET